MIKIFFYTFLLTFFSNIYSQDTLSLLDTERHYAEQDYQTALIGFRNCLKNDSTQINCFEKAALSAYRLGDVPLARELFIELEKKDSSNRLALSQLATIYDQERNIPKAIKYYTNLTKLFPENSVYYRKLAQQYQSAGLMTESFKFYSKSYDLNNRDLFSIKGLSEIFISNKQYSEADSMMLIGLEMDSLNISLHLLLAQSSYRQKEFELTVDYLERIRGRLDLSPYYNKLFGYSYIQIDSFEKSIPILNLALVDEGTKEYAHYYLATAYFELDNIEFAQHHYHEAIKEGISDNIDLYHRVLAKTYNEQNKMSKAIEHYKDAYKYGRDPVVLFYLARACDVYYKDKSIAINYYKKYLKSKDNHLEYRNYAKQRSRILKEARHLENVK